MSRIHHPKIDPMKEPKVSIIIPTFNRRDLLPIAIRSVLTQQHYNLECIVVNDGGVPVDDIVEGFRDKRLLRVNQPCNQGLARARNAGLDIATGDYVGFLDDDDRLGPRHLRQLLRVMREDEVSMVYADSDKVYLDWQEERYVEIGTEYAKDGGAYGSSDFDHNRILVNNWIPVQCHLTARWVFDDIRFDESFNPYEDWEILIAISRDLHPVHLAEATSAFTERTDGAGMLATGVADLKRLEAVKRIYAKWENVGPKITELRQQVLDGEMNNIMQAERLADELTLALGAKDVTAWVKKRYYWRTNLNKKYAYSLLRRSQIEGNKELADRLNLLIGALT